MIHRSHQKLTGLCLLLFSILALAQPSLSQPTTDQPTIRFAILGDRTGGEQEGIHSQAVAEIARLRPDFVITVGDMIEGYTNDTTILNQEWDEYLSLIAPIRCPVYFTPGNHDITFDGMQATYEKHIGRPYYSFDWQQLHIIILDNSRWDKISGFPAEQLQWLETDLETTSPDQKTLVFMHKPYWYRTIADNQPDTLHSLFKALNVDAVFTGHFHRYFTGEFDGIKYTGVGSTGGVADEDSFDMQYHYLWVTVDTEGLHIAPIRLNSVPSWDIQTIHEARLQSMVRNKGLSFVAPVEIDQNLKVDNVQFNLHLTNPLPDLPMSGTFTWDSLDNWQITPGEQSFDLPVGASTDLEFTANCSGPLYPMPTGKTILPYSTDKTTIAKISLSYARQVTARRAGTPPTIDGVIDEPIWTNSLSTLFAPDGSASICDSTFVYLAYDENNLYLAALCRESQIDQLAATYTEQDDPVYGEDCFGLMIQPGGPTDPSYQIYMNPNGAVYDQKISPGTDGYWSADNSHLTDHIVKAVVGDNYWSVEMKLPLDQFNQSINPDDKWRLTFRRKQARVASSAALQIPWSYNPNSYGQLIFE